MTNNLATHLTPEEVKNIKDLKSKSLSLTEKTEIAVTKVRLMQAEAKLAEAEASNYILNLCLKYKIDIENGENITDTGEILRKKVEVNLPELNGDSDGEGVVPF